MNKLSLKSKIYIGVILLSLVVIAGSTALRYQRNAAVRGYDSAAAEETAPAQEEAEANDSGDTPPASRLFGAGQNYGAEQTGQESVFENRMQIYAAEPVMQAFNKEIEAAIASVEENDFITGDLQEKYFNNPQIQKILLKYTKDPAFIELMKQIANDEEFLSEAMQMVEFKPMPRKDDKN